MHRRCDDLGYEVIARLGEHLVVERVKLACAIVPGDDLVAELEDGADPPAVEFVAAACVPVAGLAVEYPRPGVARQRVEKAAGIGPCKALELIGVPGFIQIL